MSYGPTRLLAACKHVSALKRFMSRYGQGPCPTPLSSIRFRLLAGLPTHVYAYRLFAPVPAFIYSLHQIVGTLRGLGCGTVRIAGNYAELLGGSHAATAERLTMTHELHTRELRVDALAP